MFWHVVTYQGAYTLGARGFSCVVSGFGQVLKSDPPEHVSACSGRSEAPRCEREKTSGTQGKALTLFKKVQTAKGLNVKMSAYVVMRVRVMPK